MIQSYKSYLTPGGIMMAYKILYEEPKQTFHHPFRIQAMTATALLIFLLLVNTFWGQGSAVIQRYLLPDNDKSCMAAQTLVIQLEEGVPFFDAVGAFCTELLNDQ